MRRFGLVPLSAVVAAPLVAQAPPPKLLPSSITGVAPATAVQPAGVTVPVQNPAPIQRFNDFRSQPPETVQAVIAMRTAADWLWRMNQPNGRFLTGVNPALKQSLPDDSDLRQATATLGLCRAARFTGDERFAVRAAQSVLAMLSLTKPDPADPTCRVPIVPADRGNRVAFAAEVVLAVAELPNADPKLVAEADGLAEFVRRLCQADGSVKVFDAPDAAKADPDGVSIYPGLALQSLLAAHRLKADANKLAAVARGIGFYRTAFKSQPNRLLAASLLPAVADFYHLTKDPAATAVGFELADALCQFQYTRADARQATWAGGFRVADGSEPTCDTAICAHGLAAAATLTRQAPDLARFARYRSACVDAILFGRGLQFTDESAEHFEKRFRSQFLVGGVHLSPTDGAVRADATARLASACVRFLESGAEARQE
jgi:hypothetical protein